MSWASRRETKLPEDLAYCLMGIFDVNMPLLYGEGEKAFLRLQEEIVKASDDQSIFCWIRTTRPGDLPSEKQQTSSFLADSPRDFELYPDMVPIQNGDVHPYEIKNSGLKITGKLQARGNDWQLFMRCYSLSKPHLFVKIPLKRLSDDLFVRIPGSLNWEFNDKDWCSSRTIYLSKKATTPKCPVFIGHSISFSPTFDPSLPTDFRIAQVYPPDRWNPEKNCIHAADLDPKSESLTDFSWQAVASIVTAGQFIVAFVGYDGRRHVPWCDLNSVSTDHSCLNLAALLSSHALSTSVHTPVLTVLVPNLVENWGLRARISMDVDRPNSLALRLHFEEVAAVVSLSGNISLS